MKLQVVEHIKRFGLADTVEKFKLLLKEYPEEKLIHLKYNQLESPMGYPEVKECRGLILHSETFTPISLGFTKFFNYGETHQAPMDWSTVQIQEKLDGTLIQLYHFNGKWFAATTGTAKGEGQVGDHNITFSEAFFDVLNKISPMFLNQVRLDQTFVFELTSPLNHVVVPYLDSRITLLGVRDMRSLEEYGDDWLDTFAKYHNLPRPNRIAFDGNVHTVLKLAKELPWTEEGYVAVDAGRNRCKIKSPAYVAVHHLRGRNGVGSLLAVVASNESCELLQYFPELSEKVEVVSRIVEDIVEKMSQFPTIETQTRKEFAQVVNNFVKEHNLPGFVASFYFSVLDGKIPNNIREFVFGCAKMEEYVKSRVS